MTVRNSTLNGNVALFGGAGGVSNGGSATIVNCTIQGNRGTGIANGAPAAVATVLNCTVSGNSERGGFPGGIDNFGSLSLGNTIIAHSRRLGGDCGGEAGITDLGHNVIEDPVANCGLVNGINGNVVGTAAGLLRMANNGGGTKTMALCTGPGMPKASCTGASPALNAGDNAICQGADVNNFDQRGVLRVTGSDPTCDIGAYESE